MRKLSFLLQALIVILSIQWASVSHAAQNCCPRSVVTGAQEPPAGADPPAPIASVNADSVREEFNAFSDKVRIVAFLSPTCPGCRSGHGVVGEVLKRFSSPKLQAILIWEPMREGDSPVTAAQQASTVHDARIAQVWNENREVGRLFAETLNLRDVAWDVYLTYEPGVRWEGQRPPSPTFWMHQLKGVDPKLLLCEDPARLKTEVEKLLDQTK